MSENFVSFITSTLEIVMIIVIISKFSEYFRSNSTGIEELLKKIIIPESVWAICLDFDAVYSPTDTSQIAISAAVSLTIFCLAQIVFIIGKEME